MRILGGIALLKPRDAEAVVVRHVREDVDPGVRECALWSLGMLIGRRADSVVREVSANDPAASVRGAATRILEVGDYWWWRI